MYLFISTHLIFLAIIFVLISYCFTFVSDYAWCEKNVNSYFKQWREMSLFKKNDINYFGNVIYYIYITLFLVTQWKIPFASYFVPFGNVTWVKSIFLLSVCHWISTMKNQIIFDIWTSRYKNFKISRNIP